jgi:type IV pilus assembly protein PilW
MTFDPITRRMERPAPQRLGQRLGRVATGFSLTEILIALVLGLVIIAALSQLYTGTKRTYGLSDAITRINENGRFAVDFITADVRMAGYLSCGGSSARIANTINGGGKWFFQTGGLEGYEGGVDTPAFADDDETNIDEKGAPVPADLQNILPGTDILVIRRATLDLGQQVLQDDTATHGITLDANHGFMPGEILVISNPSCTQASLFQVTGTLAIDPDTGTGGIKYGAIASDENPPDPGNCTDRLFGSFDCNSLVYAESDAFRSESMVTPFIAHAYYVANTNPPALARKRLIQINRQAKILSEELIQDVEDFQILYGFDTVADSNHQVDAYLTADQVTDWRRVISVHFALLMRSSEEHVRTADASPNFVLPGKTVTLAGDRRLHRSFGSLVAVRNQLP